MAENQMTVTDEISDTERRPTGVGPGERLQAARIQQGMSLEDVADRMHLSINILEAIEENDFDEITAPIFVKGYLRAYARIVSLDEDEMIQLYSEYYSEEDPPITSTSNMEPELSVTDARIKWTTYLVIIVLGALLAAWWWNKEQNQDAPISLDAQAPTSEAQESEASATASSEIAAVSESDTAPVVSADTAPVEAPEPAVEAEPAEPAVAETAIEDEALAEAVAETMAEVEAGPAETESQPAESAPMETGTVSAEAESEAATAETAEDSGAGEAAASAEPARVVGQQQGLRLTRLAPSGSDKLVVTVIADTWADIKDGADNQMVYDLLRPNQILELTGEAPFAVFLGNGHGVEITFNGEPIEFQSRVRSNNTVRLQVGE